MRYDAPFFRSKAEAARTAVTRISPALADRLSPILDRHERAVSIMAGQPLTLIHGHYRPYNIVVTPRSEPTRVCPVDWEVAGLGPPLYDFAFLAEGFKPPEMDRLGDAYRGEAAKYGLPVPDREELRRLADCYRLHRTMILLGYSADRNFEKNEVAKLIDLGQELCDRVL
jgi:aminoglycoside phosphotransferase (APT) family kinase protein